MSETNETNETKTSETGAEGYEHLPPMCRPKATPDEYRFQLFATLREEWVDAQGVPVDIDGNEMRDEAGEPRKRTRTLLAEAIGVTKQAVSQWATGSGDKSPPPWHILMWLCHQLGYVIVIAPDGLALAEAS